MNGTNAYCGVHAEGNELSTRSRLGYTLTHLTGYVLKVTQVQVFTTSILYVPMFMPHPRVGDTWGIDGDLNF